MKILFLFCLPMVIMASNVVCTDRGKLKAIVNSQEKLEKVSYCIGGGGEFFMDRKCYQNKSCSAYASLQKRVVLRDLQSPVGKLSFRVCSILKGRAYGSYYWNRNSWHPIDICSFADGSFIGAEYLLRKMYQNQK